MVVTWTGCVGVCCVDMCGVVVIDGVIVVDADVVGVFDYCVVCVVCCRGCVVGCVCVDDVAGYVVGHMFP